MVGATPCPPSRRKFDHAVTVVRHLPTSLKLQNDDRLKLYGLYKQASEEFTPKKRPRNKDWLSQAKWDSWKEVSHLTQEEAQEEYVRTLVEFLKSFPERQQAVDLVSGLERSLRLSDFQLGIDSSWHRPTHHTTRFPKSCSAELNQTKREVILRYCRDSAIYLPRTNSNDHTSILTDNPLDSPLDNDCISDQYTQFSNQIHLMHNQNFSSNVTPESPISNSTEIPDDDCSEDSYASSDDGDSLSTCTIRASNHRSYRSLASSDRQDSVDSGLSSEAELALESLQTQVAVLNQKIDLLKQDLRQTDLIRAPTRPFWQNFSIDWIKTTALNFFIGVIILTQFYRIRSVHHRSIIVYYFSYFNACCRRFIAAGRKLLTKDS